jgi:hypothetical protein
MHGSNFGALNKETEKYLARQGNEMRKTIAALRIAFIQIPLHAAGCTDLS